MPLKPDRGEEHSSLPARDNDAHQWVGTLSRDTAAKEFVSLVARQIKKIEKTADPYCRCSGDPADHFLFT